MLPPPKPNPVDRLKLPTLSKPLSNAERDLQRANTIVALQMIAEQLKRIADQGEPVTITQHRGEVEFGIASYRDREQREREEEFAIANFGAPETSSQIKARTQGQTRRSAKAPRTNNGAS